MANGRPGDHPLTDLLLHNQEVYGEPADDLIKKISKLASRRELVEWWEREIGWTPDRDVACAKAEAEYQRLAARAGDSGWEMPDDV